MDDKNNQIESLEFEPIGEVKPLNIPPELGNNMETQNEIKTSDVSQTPTQSLNSNNVYKAKQNNEPIVDTTLFNGVSIDVGITPPDDKKKKKSKKGLIFIILIVVLILGIGGGLFYFLRIANNDGKLSKKYVTTNKITLEIGTNLPTNINDYGTFTELNSSECSLNTEKIDVNKVGTHEFIITCENKEYKGNVEIKDTVKPELELKRLTKKANEEINIEDFVASCNDSSNCSFYYDNEINFSEQGLYIVKINAKDGGGNVTSKYTSLVVSDNAPKLYLTCTKNNVTDYIGIVTGSVIGDYSYRTKLIKTDTSENYSTIKNSYVGNAITLEEYTGFPNFNDDNLEIELMNILTMDMLKNENKNFPTEFAKIKAYYENNLKYTCSIKAVN